MMTAEGGSRSPLSSKGLLSRRSAPFRFLSPFEGLFSHKIRFLYAFFIVRIISDSSS
jgi:hypothetical protein